MQEKESNNGCRYRQEYLALGYCLKACQIKDKRNLNKWREK
jgi:hypothetical protein